MLSPEELGEDAGPEHPTRRDDVPGRAHQKIREVRPRRQAAHHAVGERGPPHADPDESLEQPLPAEFAPAHAVVGREVLTPYPPLPAGDGELWTSPLSGTERGTGGEDGDEAFGGQLCAAEGTVNPLARERIEEVGGVTHEHGAASGRDGGARPLRERTGGQNVANQSPWVEPPREPGKSVELGEKIATEVPAFAPAPAHRRERHHERHRGDAVADRSEAHVAALAHVQLANTVHPRDVRHVHRECDAPRGRRADEPEAAGDHRAQAIGADNHATPVRFPFPVSRPREDTGGGVTIENDALDREAFPDDGPFARRRGHENRVERGPWQGKAVWAGAAAEPTAHGGPAGRDHLRPVQLGVRRTLHCVEDAPAEPLENFRGRRAQVLGTRFVARETGAVHEQDRCARAGEQQGSCRAGRTGPDDDDVPAVGHDAAVSTAAAAPTSVAARFTPSLSSHRQPLASRTGSWHTVLPRSNRASHAGHSYLPCSVAPKRESASIPATPAAVSVTNPGAMPRGAKAAVNPAISAAPATPPSVPRAVIPPEVPRVTLTPEVMRRGGKGE